MYGKYILIQPKVSMMITNCNHAIIRNRFGKKTNGIEDILKSLW